MEVDRSGVLGARGLEPVGDAVDDEHPAGALAKRRRDHALPDDARAEDQNGVALADLCEPDAEPTGRQDVGDHDRLVVGYALGHLDQRVVRIRDACVLGSRYVCAVG